MSYDTTGVDHWTDLAKCKGMDTEMWYPPRDKDLYTPIADKAKAICNGTDGMPECPVRLKCMLYADSMDDTHGIWGGLSHRERNARKRKAAKHGMTLEEWEIQLANQAKAELKAKGVHKDR